MRFTYMFVVLAQAIAASALPAQAVGDTGSSSISSSANNNTLFTARAAPCSIMVKFEQWWREGTSTRWRVRVTAAGKGLGEPFKTPSNMLREWCRIAREQIPAVTANFICVEERTGNSMWADISTPLDQKQQQYNNFHQNVVNAWRRNSKNTCDVSTSL